MSYNEILKSEREYIIDLFNDCLENKSQLKSAMIILLNNENEFNSIMSKSRAIGSMSIEVLSLTKLIKEISEKINNEYFFGGEFSEINNAGYDAQQKRDRELFNLTK